MKRDVKNAVLGGICAGIANSLNVSPLFIRILFIFATLCFPLMFFVYFVLWAVMPAETDAKSFLDFKPLKLDTEHRILAGVCAGIANSLGVDVTVVRVLWVIGSLWFGFGLIAYVIMWLLMQQNS